MFAQVPRDERRANGVGNAVDRHEALIRKLNQGSADGRIAVQSCDHLALQRLALIKRNLRLSHRASAIEEVIEDGHVGEVEEGLVRFQCSIDERLRRGELARVVRLEPSAARTGQRIVANISGNAASMAKLRGERDKSLRRCGDENKKDGQCSGGL